MNSAWVSIALGLASGLVWGTGDFLGGLGTRRAALLGVLALAETAGLGMLALAALAFREPTPTLPVIAWGIAGGLSGTLGLAALFRGLATGRASVVAPVAAVVSTAIPALFTAFTVGLPPPLTLIGFAFALGAIVLASQSAHAAQGANELGLALVAGVGFGGFFVFIHQAGSESTFVPLAIARGISIPLLLLAMRVRGSPPPPRRVLPVVLFSGLFDAGGNVLFLLASQMGRLDVATILSSLYPASTVILSRLVLGERTTRLQQLGVVAALLAIMLIAL